MFLFFSRKYVNEMLDIKATFMWETINKSAKAITTASWVKHVNNTIYVLI